MVALHAKRARSMPEHFDSGGGVGLYPHRRRRRSDVPKERADYEGGMRRWFGRSRRALRQLACRAQGWPAGTHTVIAARSTLTVNDFTFLRSPPSSSYSTFRFSLTFTDCAFVVCTNGDFVAL